MLMDTKSIKSALQGQSGIDASGIVSGVVPPTGGEKLLSKEELVQKATMYARATHGRVSKRPWEDLRIWRNDPEYDAAVEAMPSIRRSIPESQQEEFWTIYNKIVAKPKPQKVTEEERERAQRAYDRSNY